MDNEIIGERVMVDRSTGEIVQPLGPIYAEDVPYQDVPDSQALVRYMDLWKFEDLLRKKSLYFCRADKFPDPLEGTISKDGVHQQSRSDLAMKERIRLAPQSYQEMSAYRDIARSVTFVNCWHINNTECSQMWKAYTTDSESVLLISSAGRLKAALERPIMMSAVKYIDEQTPRTEFDERSLFFYKDTDYAFEKEYRLIVDLHDLGGSIDPANPDDNFRMISVDLEMLVYGLQMHPGATEATNQKIANLVNEFLPQLTNTESGEDKKG